jgi:hypothetical protein
MKPIYTFLLILFAIGQLAAQDIMKDISSEICDCVNERGYSDDDDSCFKETMAKYNEEIEAAYGDYEDKTRQNMVNADLIFYFADCPVLAEAMKGDLGMDLSKLPWLTAKKCKKGIKGKYRFTEPLSGEIATVEITNDTYIESYTDEILKYSIEWEGCDATITFVEGSGAGYTSDPGDEGKTFKMTFRRGGKEGLAGLIYLPIFGDIMPMPRLYTSMD